MVVSFSYAYIKYETKEKNENIIGTECIKIEMEELTEALNLYHAYPMKEAKDAYKFKIRNACGVGVDYQVELEVEDVEENQLPSQDIAVKLDSNKKLTLTQQMEDKDQETYEIGTGTLKPYEEKSHEVRIWIDESAGNESQNKIFKSKVVIEAVQNEIAIYSEPLLQGADPVLGKGMVAVQINESNGEVTKADPTAKWYEYGQKKWANAVILANGKTEENYKAGEKIEESDIESYFVWIPKYSYKLFDEKLGEYTSLEETVQDKGPTTVIDIRFGLENTKNENPNECTTPGKSGDKGLCKQGDWMTHPAFLAFGGNGLWVGKFETSNSDIATTNSNDTSHNAVEPTKVNIKPNVYSWRSITVGNAFNTSKQYKTELQSHLMKNTEWGAVAYLTNSLYGRCDKETEKCIEVMINNSQNYVTGVSAKNAPTTGNGVYNDYGNVTSGSDNENDSGEFKGAYNYKNPLSNSASTSGNYSGIYDMSGGAWEYVMGVMESAISTENDKSGLTLGEIEDRYYDKYSSTKDTDFNKRILGDATGEIGPFATKVFGQQTNRESSWYEDFAWFVCSSSPWFERGGGLYAGFQAGVFAFGRYTGAVASNLGFRIVLAPTNSVS